MSTKIEIYFSKMFATIILKNQIVATILFIVKEKLKNFKITIDNTLNNDI